MSASINLIELYGTETLSLRQRFASGKQLTAFTKDCCLKHNKRVSVESSSRCKKYRCAYENCEWSVTAYKSKAKPRDFIISSINDHHADDCIVVAKPSERQLAVLPEFRVAVTSDTQVPMKALAATLQSTSKISLQKRASSVYRAKEAVIAASGGNYEESFGLLPSLLRKLDEANAGSTLVLENDQEDCFFRVFVCLAGSIRALGLCQPVFGFDAAYSKQSKYTGRALSLLTRDGNNKNFPVAFALVASENEDNANWFIKLCLRAGVPLASAPAPPLFCDRGVLLAVAAKLTCERDVDLNLKFCSLRIIRNIRRNFNVGGQRLENLIWEVQGAETRALYEAALTKILADYGVALEKYVRDIPPNKWTVHAAESKLCGWRTTNFVESHNAVLDRNGVRRGSPLEAVKSAVKQAMVAISSRMEESKKWTAAGRTLTPYASGKLQEQQNGAGSYEVARSSETVFFVNRQGNRKMNRVSTEPISCSCTTHCQLGLPCRHILSVLHFTKQQSRLLEAFGPCYTVANFSGFGQESIELAVDSRLEASGTVATPPTYTKLGRRAMRRIRSGGEGRVVRFTGVEDAAKAAAITGAHVGGMVAWRWFHPVNCSGRLST